MPLDSLIRTLRNYFSSTISHSHDDRRYVINALDQIPPVVARVPRHAFGERWLLNRSRPGLRLGPGRDMKFAIAIASLSY